MLTELFVLTLAMKGVLLLAPSVQLPGEQAPVANASLGGVVRVAGTGEPVQDAVVVLAGPTRMETRTEARGAYTFRDVPPGRYRIMAWIKRPAWATLVADLAPGQSLTSLDIFVPGLGEVSGRVLDENGEPIPEADVLLVGREYRFGALRYSPHYPTKTDDRGRYKLDRLLAGRSYLVLAKKRKMILPAISDAPQDPKLRRSVFAPTYYPSSSTPEGAQPLTLQAGEIRDNVDIRALRSPSYCIEGVLGMHGPPGELRFEIFDQEPSRGIHSGGAVFTAEPAGTTGPDGRIRVCDLPPGQYRLTARSPHNTAFYGAALVAVTDADVNNVTVHALPHMALPGKIIWLGCPPEKSVQPRLNIVLQPLQRAPFLEEGLMVTSTPSNDFLFPNLLVDEYAVRIQGLTGNLYIKDILYGGESFLHRPLRPGSAIGNVPLTILVGCDGTFLAAKVTDKEGKPVPNTHIVLVPAGITSHPMIAATMITGQADMAGVYRSAPFAPGRYRILTSDVIPDGTPEYIGWLSLHLSQAQQVELHPDTTLETIVLTVSAKRRR
jgi:hypothetical protein